MLFAVYTLLLVITRKKYKGWLIITDLTDNKTLISFLFFIAALATLKWKHNKWMVALAVQELSTGK